VAKTKSAREFTRWSKNPPTGVTAIPAVHPPVDAPAGHSKPNTGIATGVEMPPGSVTFESRGTKVCTGFERQVTVTPPPVRNTI
jgi:hypothetical protein